MSPAPDVDRRAVLRGLAAAVAALPTLGTVAAPSASAASAASLGSWPVSTLEAFADTLVPGERRSSSDRAIAGAAPGPGAVQAGVIALLTSPNSR